MIAVFIFIVVACVVFLFVRTNTLRARVEHIERYLQQRPLPQGAEQPHAPPSEHGSVVVQPPTMSPVMTSYMGGASSITPHTPDAMDRFSAWVKEDWLMKLGAFLIILGVGWFVSYAIAENWIGEVGRIFLGLLGGAIVLALGWYRLQQFVTQGAVLMFTGATVVVLTLFAARELYDMFTPLVALTLMFGTSALLGVTSVVRRHQALAYGNVLLAGVAPLLIDATLTIPEIFTYLLVLSVGAVGVAVVTGWRNLILLSLVLVFLYSISSFTSWNAKDLDVGLTFAFIFSALYFAVSVLAMRVQKKVQVVDLFVALGTGTFLLMWILAGAKDEWQSMLLVVWTMVFAFGAFHATRLGAGIAYFYAYAGVGVVYLGVATAIELEGPTLAIASIIEAFLVLWVGYRIVGKIHNVPVLAIPCVVPILLSFESIGSRAWRGWDSSMYDSRFGYESNIPTWYDKMFHADAFVLVFLIAVLILVGILFYQERMRLGETERVFAKKIAQVAWVVAGLYGAILTWLISHALFVGQDTGTMTALLVYTLVAVGFYSAHRVTGDMWKRHVATAFTIFVTARLLLVEAWNMDLGERVVVFLVVGVALAGVAWLERSGKKTNHV